jgi:hypothetical protein
MKYKIFQMEAKIHQREYRNLLSDSHSYSRHSSPLLLLHILRSRDRLISTSKPTEKSRYYKFKNNLRRWMSKTIKFIACGLQCPSLTINYCSKPSSTSKAKIKLRSWNRNYGNLRLSNNFGLIKRSLVALLLTLVGKH